MDDRIKESLKELSYSFLFIIVHSDKLEKAQEHGNYFI